MLTFLVEAPVRYPHPAIFLSLAFLSLGGCMVVMNHQQGCTDMAAASVGVTVRTADGGSMDGLRVVYTADGGPERACDHITGDWICGYEVDGNIKVTATLPGYVEQSQMVVVGSDECHVIQEFVDIVLEPDEVACTDIAIPAVEVHLSGSGGEVLDHPMVTWEQDSTAPNPCDTQDGGLTWECGWEVSGMVYVEAAAGGHVTHGETVSVPLTEDGCHPVTQQVEIALEWAPD